MPKGNRHVVSKYGVPEDAFNKYLLFLLCINLSVFIFPFKYNQFCRVETRTQALTAKHKTKINLIRQIDIYNNYLLNQHCLNSPTFRRRLSNNHLAFRHRFEMNSVSAWRSRLLYRDRRSKLNGKTITVQGRLGKLRANMNCDLPRDPQ